jgi:hypothetical protein
MPKEKISLKMVKKIPPSSLLRIINKMKKKLKKSEEVQKIFNDYGLDIDELDYVPMMFKNLEVSAKCDHGIIYFNYKLLCNGDFEDNYSYAAHELTHFCQQTAGDKPTQSADDGDYLSNKFEQEGFQNQVEYIAKNKGEDEAKNYVDDLLDHHDKDGKEAEKLKDILLDKVEAALDASEPWDTKRRISHIKKLLAKYHPDHPDTADLTKFRVLKDELAKLQGLDMPPPATEEFPTISENTKPYTSAPWGDWYSPEKYRKYL